MDGNGSHYETIVSHVEGRQLSFLDSSGEAYDLFSAKQVHFCEIEMKTWSEVKSLSRTQLFVTPMDCRLPGSSIYRIFQARILEWVALSWIPWTIHSMEFSRP